MQDRDTTEGIADRDPAASRTLNAVILGAQRCGTTSFAQLLDTHPDVCLARGKEAHWFDDAQVQRDGVSTARWADRFSHYAGQPVLLDAAPSYLYLPGCIEALYRHNPNLKVIAVLRDPAERARSQYAHERQRGVETGRYWQALQLESRRLAADRNPLAPNSAARVSSFRDRGRYSRQIGRLLEWFPDALVLRFDELVNESATTAQRVTEHLGVTPFPPAVTLKWLNRRRLSRPLSPLDALVRRSFRADMRATEDLLGWQRGSLASARLGRRSLRRPAGDAG